MRFAVLMKGILRGMGRQAPCELLATKILTPESPRPAYSHCAVIEAPTDLPDGEYEVEFGDEVAATRLHNGCWTVGSPLPHTYAEAVSFYSGQQQGATLSRPRSREPRKSASPKASGA